jgi:integrase/recombinase XerD
MNTDKPILQLIDDFLSEHQGTQSTKKKYREALDVFVKWITINVDDLGNMKFADLLRYKNWLESSGRAQATIVSYVVAVRQFFTYLDEYEIYRNISTKLKASIKEHTFKRKPLSTDQVKLLLGSIERNSIIGKRDYAIINLMVRTGLRSIEVSRLDMGDFQKENDTWQMSVQRKGSKSKIDQQGITDKSMDPVIDYFNGRDQDNKQPAFINHSHRSNIRITSKSISRIVKERLRAAGINDPLISCHSLRHTAATTAIKQGTDIFHVKAMMGHRRIETTMIYVNIIEAEIKKQALANKNIDNAY